MTIESSVDHSELAGQANESTERELSGDEINLVVAQIKRITRSANLEFALRVGGVIIHHFYEGDTSAWRARGAKSLSFRRLSRHPELPFSAGTLYRCVALFELCERLNAASRWEHLGASHLRVVLGLPPDAQERVLAAANKNRWTVKMLHSSVAREKASSTPRRGRRPQPKLVKSWTAVTRCLEEHMSVLHDIRTAAPDDVNRSVHLLMQARDYLDSLSGCLEEALSRCDMEASLSTSRKGPIGAAMLQPGGARQMRSTAVLP